MINYRNYMEMILFTDEKFEALDTIRKKLTYIYYVTAR